MTTCETDDRSPERRARDERIAAEPPMPPAELPPDAPFSSVETQLARHGQRVAGIVENGVVRPVDPTVKLPEHSRVIIVPSEPSGPGVSAVGAMDQQHRQRIRAALEQSGANESYVRDFDLAAGPPSEDAGAFPFAAETVPKDREAALKRPAWLEAA